MSEKCQICGKIHKAHSSPMLKDAIWNEIADDVDGYMCYECMTKRLGRNIKEEDLMMSPFPDLSGHVYWNIPFLRNRREIEVKEFVRDFPDWETMI